MALSTTSLLNSAASRRNKIQEMEDSLVAFEYSLSAKTYGDFQAYNNYLQDRANKNNGDPSKVLTYQKAIVGARKGYVTNEIQRANIDIIEGRGDNNTKYEKMKELFYQALDNGDYDLAQTLNLQLDNLSVKIQQEEISRAEAQQRAYGSAAAAGAKSTNDLRKKLEKGVDDITLADGSVVTPLAAIARDMEKAGFDNATWMAAQETMTALRNLTIDEYTGAESQDKIDELEQKYGAGLQDIDEVLKFNIGGKGLTAQDIMVAVENEAINNPIYNMKAVRNEATGLNEFKLEMNQVDRAEYTRQYDEQGNEYFAPTTVRTDQDKLMFGQSDQGRGLDTQITNDGAVIGGPVDGDSKRGKVRMGGEEKVRDDSQSIGNRLKSFGIIAKQNGTTLVIKLPGESVERTATIQPDGSIRYFSDDGQMAEIGLVDRNLGSNARPQLVRAGEQRVVAPDEISDFGTASAFGGKLSQASSQGREYLRNYTTGLQDMIPTDLRKGRITSAGNALPGSIRTGLAPMGTFNDFSGRGAPVLSSLLQGASFTQGNILKEKQAAVILQAQQEAQQRLQQATAFNLNQTPVSQFASNGVLKSQLRVQPLPAQPRLRVVAPTPQPRVAVQPLPAQPRVVVEGARTYTLPGLSF